jgi:hypothetical protein
MTEAKSKECATFSQIRFVGGKSEFNEIIKIAHMKLIGDRVVGVCSVFIDHDDVVIRVSRYGNKGRREPVSNTTIDKISSNYIVTPEE